MTKDGYFTDFIDSGTGVWCFKLSDEVSDFGVAIINPKNKESFTVGDNLTVEAFVNKATNAKLTIGEHNEFIGNLENQRKVIFDNRTFTNEDVGDLTLRVESRSDLVTDVATSTVQIQVKWPSIAKQIEDIKRKKVEDINNYYRTLYGDPESVIYGTGVWESTLCGADIVKYVQQNKIVVERDKDYSHILPILEDKPYGVDPLTQYAIYKDFIDEPMSYGEFMNICCPYWEEDWRTLGLKELYKWVSIFSVAVGGYFAISNVQISRININIPKINWGSMDTNGYAMIYVAPSISMTTVSTWAVDIAGVPSILLEQIAFYMTNNGISGSPNFGGGAENTGSLKPQGLMDELATSGVKHNPNDVVMVIKISNGKLLWLENGTNSAGLKHILNRHAANFNDKGVSDIVSFLQQILRSTPINTGMGAGGPFADYLINGNTYRVAYGANGFIVSFYPIK